MATLQWPVLVKGAEDDNVKAAQYLLWCWRESPKLEPDGVFGKNTEDAVKAFQHAAHLHEDGRIGEETWTRMTDTKTIQGSLLKKGMKGHCVGALQAELIKNRELRPPIDGDFGELTDAAVRRFQRKAGITEDGRVGVTTWQNLICRGNS
jgi:peptidoglycan hydrolase-like protein with peptidoglycan-binding domain